MMRLAALLSLLLVGAQEDGLAKARALIQKLRSESIEDRESARKSLLDMGKTALPALREFERDPDGEVARTVTMLLRRLDYLEKLTPRFLKSFPNAETRFAEGGEAEVLATLREATRTSGKTYPLTRTDLNPIVSPALRAPMSDEKFNELCETIGRLKLNGAVAELRAILKEHPTRAAAAAYTLQFLVPLSAEEIAPLLKEGGSSRGAAAYLLESIAGDEANKLLRLIAGEVGSPGRAKAAIILSERGETGPLLELLESGDADSLQDAVASAGQWGSRETAARLLKILESPARRFQWEMTMRALTAMRAPEGIPGAIRLLSDKDIHVREGAAILLYVAGSAKHASHAPALIKDSYIPVQLIGMKAAAAWKARECIPTLREMTHHAHGSLRTGAIQALGALDAREAIPDLLRLPRDKDRGEERIAVVCALAALNAREAVPEIAGMIEDDWSNGYHTVMAALRELRAHEQIPAIAARLKDSSSTVRLSILDVLANFGWSQTSSEVAKLLRDPDPKVRGKAAWTLASMNATDQAPAIEKALVDGGDAIAYPALSILARLDPARAEPHMRKALANDTPMIRTTAIFWLARRGDPQALEALEKLALDPGDYVNSVREAILELPSNLQPRFARKLLETLHDKLYYVDRLAPLADADTRERWAAKLADKDPEVRVQAITLLHSAGETKFNPRIRALIEDPDPKVRGAALSALAAQGLREIAPEVKERLFDVDFMVRWSAVSAVQLLGLTEAVPDLEELLVAESHDSMPGRVAEMLGHLKSKSSVPRLRALLKQEDPYLLGKRGSALRALAQIGDLSAIEDMARLLDDPDPRVRATAARALAHLGGTAQVGRIEALLRDPDSNVRVNAADVLAGLGERKSAPVIEELLKDPATQVRDSAAVALLRMGSPAGVPRLLNNAEYNVRYTFSLLNGVRRPEASSRLRNARVTKTLRGSIREMVVAELAPLGFRLDDAAVQGEAWKKFAATPSAFEPSLDYDRLILVLENCIVYPFDFVLEEDRVRVITSAQARVFWKEWWAERQSKK